MATSARPCLMPRSEEDHFDEEPLYQDKDKPHILSRSAYALNLAKDTGTVDVPIDKKVASGLARRFKTKAKQSLGNLDRLPPELIFAVCRELDVRSCITLRQVNRRARQTVSSLVEYRAVFKHALPVVQAVLWSGMGHRVTLPDLYHLLCTHECMVCSLPASSDSFRFYDSRAPKNRPKIAPGVKGLEVGQAALGRAMYSGEKDKDGNAVTLPAKKRPTALTVLAMDQEASLDNIVGSGEVAAGLYVFLPTLTRCCKPCLEESARLRVVPLLSLRNAADIPRRHFLPYACIPWLVERGADGQQLKKKTTAKGNIKGKGKKGNKATAADNIQKRLENHLDEATVTQGDAAQLLFDAGYTSKRVQQVLYECGYLDEFSWWGEVEQRISFTVSMAFLDRRTSVAGLGYTCRGCDAAIQRMYGHLKVDLEYTNTVYSTEAAFLAHFAMCPEAIKLWKESGSQ
ncbi:hypothetical protein SCUCBS95973_006384 [Sporothrix curviconia]|uniref:F-box domain-containing protein n=1 Tax=Sporothrix curviconia TaxID=1260050 RepID=A0ABP0C4Q3_9PEZI